MNYSYAPVYTIGTIGIAFESKQTILVHITQLSIAIFMLLWLEKKIKLWIKKITHLDGTGYTLKMP